MKKILFVALALLSILAFSACSTNHKKGERVYNDTHHWYGCKHLNCDTRIEEEPHTWDEGEVLMAATDSREGLKVYFCTVCGAAKREAIPKLPSVTVKEEGWDRAFSVDNFQNVTATLTEKIISEGKEYKIEYSIMADGALMYVTTVRCEDGVEVSYSATLQDGNLQWRFTSREEKIEDVTPVFAPYADVMTGENVLKNYNLDFTGLYSSFTYNGEAQCYTANELTVGQEQMSNVTVTVKDGKIASVVATVGNGAEISVTLADYGKTVPKR